MKESLILDGALIGFLLAAALNRPETKTVVDLIGYFLRILVITALGANLGLMVVHVIEFAKK